MYILGLVAVFWWAHAHLFSCFGRRSTFTADHRHSHSVLHIIMLQVTKRFSERKQVHVGMEVSKTNQTRWE